MLNKDETNRVKWTDVSCDAGINSGVQILGVVLDVVVHEGVDEEVAVVVALQEENMASKPRGAAAGDGTL